MIIGVRIAAWGEGGAWSPNENAFVTSASWMSFSSGLATGWGVNLRYKLNVTQAFTGFVFSFPPTGKDDLFNCVYFQNTTTLSQRHFVQLQGNGSRLWWLNWTNSDYGKVYEWNFTNYKIENITTGTNVSRGNAYNINAPDLKVYLNPYIHLHWFAIGANKFYAYSGSDGVGFCNPTTGVKIIDSRMIYGEE